MSDLETFIDMLKRQGIEPEVGEMRDESEPFHGLTAVKIAQHGKCPNVVGYPFFFTAFFFDETGGFRMVGIWE